MDADADLMLQVAGGDPHAFASLVEHYRVRAVNFAYRFLGDRHDAEDLAQEAFVRVYQSRQRYRPSATFSTWFFRILSNLCLNEIRRRKRQGLVPEPPDAASTAAPDPSASPEARYEQQELGVAVRRALADLPEKQRLAVILQRYEDMDYEQIGRIVGVSRGAVDGLLSRAKESLRRRLTDHF
ncbi:MAG: RNA polymerase sigma factor [Armatimonadetes bacterium]|nr:RNA polymerase sigma factor [Armatimonadota bacterium]